MKLLTMLAALVAFGAGTAQAGERTVQFTVDKMYCDACPLIVGKAMRGVRGVKSVKVDYSAKTAIVVFDDAAATAEAVAAASTNAGYPARPAAN